MCVKVRCIGMDVDADCKIREVEVGVAFFQ